MEIVKISFDEIYPIWDQKLWPNRSSKIEPHSILQCDLTYDANILTSIPTFLACMIDGNIAGVNSGFKTSNGQYRSRGLYVDPIHRGLGISKLLLYGVEEQGIKEDCKMIWTIPRQQSMPAYASAGYTRISEYFTDGMEFGPNCIAIKYLTKN